MGWKAGKSAKRSVGIAEGCARARLRRSEGRNYVESQSYISWKDLLKRREDVSTDSFARHRAYLRFIQNVRERGGKIDPGYNTMTSLGRYVERNTDFNTRHYRVYKEFARRRRILFEPRLAPTQDYYANRDRWIPEGPTPQCVRCGALCSRRCVCKSDHVKKVVEIARTIAAGPPRKRNARPTAPPARDDTWEGSLASLMAPPPARHIRSVATACRARYVDPTLSYVRKYTEFTPKLHVTDEEEKSSARVASFQPKAVGHVCSREEARSARGAISLSFRNHPHTNPNPVPVITEVRPRGAVF